MKPDGAGIVRFAVDVAVLGHTDAIDPSGRIGPKDSQNYFSIDVRGDTFYVEGALYPGGTIPGPTVLGRNTTTLRSFSNVPNAFAPNYRFEFEIKLG